MFYLDHCLAEFAVLEKLKSVLDKCRHQRFETISDHDILILITLQKDMHRTNSGNSIKPFQERESTFLQEILHLEELVVQFTNEKRDVETELKSVTRTAEVNRRRCER